MVTSRAKTVAEYLRSLPSDRRAVIAAVRKTIRKNLPKGYRETMNWGMIAYEIPLSRYPDTYNGQPLMYAALASQKNYCAVYLTNVYGHPETREWFLQRWKETGKKLDMGKSCIRFKSLADLPLELIGETIARTNVANYIAFYQRSRQ